MDVAEQDLLGEDVLDVALDGATQRTGTENRVETTLGDQRLRSSGEFDPHVAIAQTVLDFTHHQVDDVLDILAGQLVEHHDLVHAVQELGTEVLLQLVRDLGLHLFVAAGLVGVLAEAQIHRLGNVPCAQVGGHHDHGVLEVHHTTLRIGEATLVEDLQQRVEDVRVRLFDLVEQHNTERLATHLLRELATLFVTDISGRGTEHPRSGVLLGVFAHVQCDQGVLVTEQEFGERLGQLGLADTGGPGEDERAAGPLRVLQACAGTTDRARQRLHRIVLADVAPADLLLHLHQPGGFLLGQLEDRNAGGARQHLGNRLFVHLCRHVGVAHLPGFLLLGPGDGELALVVPQPCCQLEVLRIDRSFLLQADGGDALVELAKVRRRRHPADAQPCPRLVDQVDRLVRKEAVGDVPVSHLGSGGERPVRDGDAVVRLVAVTQATQDVDRERDRRLVHLDRLEPTLERSVLLDVLAVLVEGGRTDGLQLAACQHRLQDGGCIDRSLGSTGTDERVDLVDEQHDVPARLDLLEHLLQTLLEVTTVAGTRNERAQVEGVDLLVTQGFGNVAAHDGLTQALDDGRLADAGLADQHRVVLGAPREHGHDALDLLLASDDRVELVLSGILREVAAELVEDRRRGRGLTGLRGAGGGRLLALEARQQLQHLVADAVEVGPQLDQHLGRDAFTLTDQAEQDVLRADVGVVDLERLAHRELQHLLGARGEGNVSGGSLLALTDDLLHLLADGLERDAERLQSLRCDAFTLMDQPEQEVLGTDVVVVEHARLVLGEDNHSPGAVGEPVEHAGTPNIQLLRAPGWIVTDPPARHLSLVNAAAALSVPVFAPGSIDLNRGREGRALRLAERQLWARS